MNTIPALVIEHGIPLGNFLRPGTVRNMISSTFQMMHNLDSFVITEKRRGIIYQVAREAGLKITSKKLENGMIRVWLLSGADEKVKPVLSTGTRKAG
jgi:hypothetical protein